MFKLTPVVRDLLIINVLAFFGTTFVMGDPLNFSQLINSPSDDISGWFRYQLASFYPTSPYFRPFQIVTYMFMHANFNHLFMNMFGLIMFGPIVETYLGKRDFFLMYFLSGIGAYALFSLVKYFEMNYMGGSTYLANVPMVGASGCVFAILAAFGTLFPNQKIHLLFPPVSLKAKYMISIYIGIELFLGLGPFQTGVAHFAHLGGAVVGILFVLLWKRR